MELIIEVSERNARHALGSIFTPAELDGDVQARWAFVEAEALAHGWALTGWRTYAQASGGYRVRAELHRSCVPSSFDMHWCAEHKAELPESSPVCAGA